MRLFDHWCAVHFLIPLITKPKIFLVFLADLERNEKFSTEVRILTCGPVSEVRILIEARNLTSVTRHLLCQCQHNAIIDPLSCFLFLLSILFMLIFEFQISADLFPYEEFGRSFGPHFAPESRHEAAFRWCGNKGSSSYLFTLNWYENLSINSRWD